MTWQPLFDKLRKEHSGDVLHEGMPEWMWPGVLAWLEPFLDDRPDNLRRVQEILRINLDWSSSHYSAWASLRDMCIATPELSLELVNLVLAWHSYGHEDRRMAQNLAEVLYRSGSAWTVRYVDDGHFALERRLTEEIEERARAVMQVRDRSGEHLRIAWHALYSREPNPDKAHEHAIKAVEAAGGPVITPNDARSTLGKMLGEMRSNRDRWTVTGSPSPRHDDDPAQAVRAMMELVWESHEVRHGSADPSTPITIDPDVAETALHIAITLVHLFREGHIRRTS